MKVIFVYYQKLCVFEVLKFIEAWVQRMWLKIAHNSKGERSTKEWAHMESIRGSKSVEQIRSKRRIEKSKMCWNDEHSAIGTCQ